jgi:hypothetical protein
MVLFWIWLIGAPIFWIARCCYLDRGMDAQERWTHWLIIKVFLGFFLLWPIGISILCIDTVCEWLAGPTDLV